MFPGAVNSVPSRARIEVDVRDIDQSRRDAVLAKIAAATDEIAARRRVSATTEVVNADPPAQSAPAIVDADGRRLPGTRRDRRSDDQPRIPRHAVHGARRARPAMVFIPCRGGVSHRPDEHASPEAIALGTAVLADTLARLSHVGA